jgi:hypothetical protein
MKIEIKLYQNENVAFYAELILFSPVVSCFYESLKNVFPQKNFEKRRNWIYYQKYLWKWVKSKWTERHAKKLRWS